jgi:hypothetical protein
MTPEQIDLTLWNFMGKPKRSKAIRYYYNRLMESKPPIIEKPFTWPEIPLVIRPAARIS